MTSTNILIVGNGFDLSHYLPTKYDHFMDVMEAIENKKTGGKVPKLEIHTVQEWMDILDDMFLKNKNASSLKFEMKFDELFSKIRDVKFIEKTKEYYLIDEILISSKDVLKIQYRLEMNCWYKYFKDHVKEVKTWIDFEQKIEEVILSSNQCCSDILNIHDNNMIYKYFSDRKEGEITIIPKNLNILQFFDFMKQERYETTRMRPVAGYESGSISPKKYSERLNINPSYCLGGKIIHGFNPSLFLDKLHSELEQFIEIFNLYLNLVIHKLSNASDFFIKSENWKNPSKIYSFNYTDTFQRLYQNTSIDYLHGSSKEEQNIVLGISDLTNGTFKQLKAYGFTKYHQKLFKDTDYLFLDDYKSKIIENNKKLEIFEREKTERERQVYRESMTLSSHLNLNITIWGHSLDISDKDYILDLFSLNDEMDRNVRITVFYYDKNAKFSLLNNLLAILGKDKVEKWMKNKWLMFEENPKIDFGIEQQSLEKEAS